MRKDATRDARDARVMGRVDAMTISRLWVRGGDGRRRARSPDSGFGARTHARTNATEAFRRARERERDVMNDEGRV